MSRAIYPSLKGKRVFISGGGSGIGEGLVKAYAMQGAHVAFCDIAIPESEALAARLSGCAFTPIFHACDLRDIDALQAMMARVEADLGGIDILINNAANDDRHTIEDVTQAYWDERMAVNLRHQFFAAQAAIPAMKRAGGTDPTKVRTEIAKTSNLDGLTGVIKGFTPEREVVKPLQVQIVKDGNFRHYAVIDDPELIAQ